MYDCHIFSVVVYLLYVFARDTVQTEQSECEMLYWTEKCRNCLASCNVNALSWYDKLLGDGFKRVAKSQFIICTLQPGTNLSGPSLHFWTDVQSL